MIKMSASQPPRRPKKPTTRDHSRQSSASVQFTGLRWTNAALSHLPALTQMLANEIASGRRPIGSMLPAEHELCHLHGLSRYAVREAMTQLQDLGLIEKRRGIGTRVVADRPRSHHLYRLDSTEDLIAFTRGTEFVVSDRRIVTSNDDFREVGWSLSSDHPWMRIDGIRYVAGSRTVVSADTALVHTKYAGFLQQGSHLDTNIFVLIERHHGLSPQRVEQEIRATLVPPQLAKALHVAPNSAGLIVARQFIYDEGVLAVTKSLHPADSFGYSTTYRITRGPNKSIRNIDGR